MVTNKNILKDYYLNLNPKKWYVALRTIVHFITIPYKMSRNLIFPEQFVPENYELDEDGSVSCDKQCLYYFFSDKSSENTLELTKKLIQGKYLLKGFDTKSGLLDTRTVSGKNLAFLNLAVLNSKDADFKDGFELLISNIIKNDYSLIEYHRPEIPLLAEIYDERLVEAMFRQEIVNMKSLYGRMCPEIDLEPKNALVILASLAIIDKKIKSQEGKKYFDKLFWRRGYCLLALAPSNDIESLISLYILIKLSNGSWFWKIPMLFLCYINKNKYSDLQEALISDAMGTK